MNRTHDDQTGRAALRVLLATFVAVSLATLAIPGTFGADGANAQTSPTPAPSGPAIQFLNPSGATANSGTSGPGREISARRDVDTAYHLVAWVTNVPDNPTVEFKYQSGSNPEITIGQATLAGSDTYELFWEGSRMPADGTYSLKAVLFSNGSEVSRDQETVVINNQDATKNEVGQPTSENQGQAVEITYPTNAGEFGLYRRPGTNNPYHGVIDATASEGNTAIRAYYTTSRPGTEPQWVRCSSPDAGESSANAADGVRCTLAANVDPASVTAVAAASGDANQTAPTGCVPSSPTAPACGEGEDSGDAHRVAPYIQIPSSVSIAPATQTQGDRDAGTADNQFSCSDVITATLLDQSSRKVAGANVDVHAAGPTDNLFFDDTDAADDQTSPHQPPDRGGHLIEATANCESTANPRPFNTGSGNGQGEHEIGGEGDIKHIETQPAGTNDAGAFRFALYNRSTTINGVTQFSAYYDRDDDDLMCSSEPRGNGSIGWNADPGTPGGLPDDTTTCPEPTPSSTGSPSRTASPTGTASGTATPSGSPSSGSSRTVTLVASDEKVEVGKQVTLSGRIVSSNSSCTDNEFVQVLKRTHGTSSFEEFRSDQTDSDGNFSVTFNARESADYQASVNAHDDCSSSSSDPVSVLVKVRITITADEFRPDRGERIRFLGKVIPKHTGTKVILQRKKGKRWVRVAKDGLNRRSRYRIPLEANWRRGREFRIKWPSQDAEHQKAFSDVIKIVTRG